MRVELPNTPKTERQKEGRDTGYKTMNPTRAERNREEEEEE